MTWGAQRIKAEGAAFRRRLALAWVLPVGLGALGVLGVGCACVFFWAQIRAAERSESVLAETLALRRALSRQEAGLYGLADRRAEEAWIGGAAELGRSVGRLERLASEVPALAGQVDALASELERWTRWQAASTRNGAVPSAEALREGRVDMDRTLARLGPIIEDEVIRHGRITRALARGGRYGVLYTVLWLFLFAGFLAWFGRRQLMLAVSSYREALVMTYEQAAQLHHRNSSLEERLSSLHASAEEPDERAGLRNAHRINNPLAAVASNVEALLEQARLWVLGLKRPEIDELARALVDTHAGLQSLRSTVRDVLPRAGVPARVANAMPPAGVRGRVLVVEDDVLVGQSLRRALHPEQDVVVEESSLAALERMGEERFDAVLCDLMMPELSGPALFRRAVAQDPSLAPRFAFMTGGAFSAEAREFLSSTPSPCLEKPFDLDEVRSVARRVVAESRRD